MSTDLRTPDQVLSANLSLISIGIILVSWVIGVAVLYDMGNGMGGKVLWYAFKITLDEPRLWVAPFIGLMISLMMFAYILPRYRNYWGGARFIKRLKGNKIISHYQMVKLTKRKEQQLIFADIPVPEKVEKLQFVVVGSTGSGKSVCINAYIESAIARNNRVICVDPDGGFLRSFYKEGDLILNPFDSRSEGWSIFNEIRSTYDCEQYAISLIPKSPSTEQETWNSMARTIVSETLSVLVKKNLGTTEQLLYWVTEADNDALKALLAGTPAMGCFHGAEDTMASIRTVLTNYITPHKFLKEGDFSFRDWLENGKGSLYITWREDMLQALKPLISAWTDVICASVLSLDSEIKRDIHLIIDELDSLEKLNYFIDVVTKGRKKGFIALPGIQSLSQLNKTYGREEAMTLRNSFRNFAVFGIGDMDSYTPVELSNAFGKHTVVRRERTVSVGSGDVLGSAKGNMNNRPIEELLITPTELHMLPDVTGYVKFSGNSPICRVTLKLKDRPQVTEPIMIDEAKYAVNRRSSFLSPSDHPSDGFSFSSEDEVEQDYPPIDEIDDIYPPDDVIQWDEESFRNGDR